MMTINRHTKRYNSMSGFTLIEIAVVMIIISFLSLSALSLYTLYDKRTKEYVTKERLLVIEESIQKFLEMRGRYPCPASFAALTTLPAFGVEGDSNPLPNVESCQFGPGFAAIAGTITAPNVRIGALPVRSLNLPDEFAVDGWGGMITYAVTTAQSSGDVNFSHAAGAITINDSAGNTVINPAGSAHYVAISHGEDQRGARVLVSNNPATRVFACPPAAEIQEENCDDNQTFVIASVYDDLGAGAYDDIGIYEVQRRPDDILPIGTILAFDATACPLGWAEYMDDVDGIGRFLLGLDPSTTTPRSEIDVALTASGAPNDRGDSVPLQPDEYFLRDLGEDGTENIPGYIALRYCIKN